MSEMVNRLTRVVNSHSWTCVLEGGAIVFHRDRPGVAISTHATEDDARKAAEALNARAALEAMREPTEAMVEAVTAPAGIGDRQWQEHAQHDYRVMINEALK